MDPLRTLRRARNDFTLAAVLFASTTGSALWIANSMDEGEQFDVHGRLPRTSQMHDFANVSEKILLVPCAIFPVISGLVFYRRQKKYNEVKEWVANMPQP